MPTEIHVYGKPGCSLCEKAIDLIDELREQFDFVVVQHNILETQVLFDQYRFRIPVVVIGDTEWLSLRFGAQELERALVAANVARIG